MWRRQSSSTNRFRMTVKTLERAQLSHALLTITGWPHSWPFTSVRGCASVAAAIPQFVSYWQPMRNTSGHLIYNSKQLLCVCHCTHTEGMIILDGHWLLSLEEEEDYRPYLCLAGSILFHCHLGFSTLSPPSPSPRLNQSLPLFLSPTWLLISTGSTGTTGLCSVLRAG